MEENNKKMIRFGFSNDKNPSGSWEGIGIKQDMLLTDAEYYCCRDSDRGRRRSWR